MPAYGTARTKPRLTFRVLRDKGRAHVYTHAAGPRRSIAIRRILIFLESTIFFVQTVTYLSDRL